ncbi:plasmid mobilization protein MobA, partial [Zooshikella harenae]
MSQSENRKKTKIIMVRVTEDEKEALEEKASDTGVSVPEFLRRAGLGRKTKSKVESQIINELNRLGGLQKHLFIEGGKGRLWSKEYAEILKAIKEAIGRVG